MKAELDFYHSPVVVSFPVYTVVASPELVSSDDGIEDMGVDGAELWAVVVDFTEVAVADDAEAVVAIKSAAKMPILSVSWSVCYDIVRAQTHELLCII